MGLLLYIIAVIVAVLLMHVADLIHPTSGDVRIGVFLGVLYFVGWILGVMPSTYTPPFWYRNPSP